MKRHLLYHLQLLVGLGALCHCSSEAAPPSLGTPAPGAAGSSAGDLAQNGTPPEEPSRLPTDSTTDGEANPTPDDVAGIAGAPALDPSAPAGGSGGAGDVPVVPETPRFSGSFILGADISSIQEAVNAGTTFIDTDAQQKSMLELLKNHGFNYVRLRTFVEPSNEFGYASGSQCQAKAEAYNDRDHTVAFAREVKAAGMGLLLDFHYSDTWADPGKQVIPEAWRGIDSVALMAEQVRAYSVDVVTALVNAGARPDMVQVGNEITPGMLIHVPTATTDCYGNNSVVNQAVNGSQNNWDNLATLLRAGIEGVKQVDPEIAIMLHLENTGNVNGVMSWVRDAQSRGVELDVLGLSAYEAFQGPATAWAGTLGTLAATFPELSFAIAEYNPQRRLLNDIMRELPDGRGLGTFFWEPTQSGSWGASMFTRQGSTLTANASDFAEYDQLRQDYGL